MLTGDAVWLAGYIFIGPAVGGGEKDLQLRGTAEALTRLYSPRCDDTGEPCVCVPVTQSSFPNGEAGKQESTGHAGDPGLFEESRL